MLRKLPIFILGIALLAWPGLGQRERDAVSLWTAGSGDVTFQPPNVTAGNATIGGTSFSGVIFGGGTVVQ